MKFLQNESEIKNVITEEDVKTVQIIMSENENECSMIVGTEMFSTLYLISYNKRQFVYDELWDTKVKVFLFTDSELSEAWKTSYLNGGIEEERWDRRTIFHPYNEMNEMFCIDMMLLEEILGISRHQDHIPKWKVGMIEWYRKKLLN